jgi:hypothetical protein
MLGRHIINENELYREAAKLANEGSPIGNNLARNRLELFSAYLLQSEATSHGGFRGFLVYVLSQYLLSKRRK